MAVRPQSFAVPNAPASEVVVSIDPATGETLAQFPATPPSALPAIFERARRAQRDWATRPLRERAACLRRLRDVIFSRRDEIASAVSRESGKPRVEALLAEVFLAIDTA
ncbi:MAG: aldehyde dehydrogenase family protein, partial [Candidatus Acidiferrales bacterium]